MVGQTSARKFRGHFSYVDGYINVFASLIICLHGFGESVLLARGYEHLAATR